MRLGGGDIGHDGVEGVLVVLHLGQLEQFERAGEALVERLQAMDDLLERGALAAEALGLLGLVPDRRAFQLAAYFFETFDLLVVVKGTPSAHPAGP
jgi:hypothetical protein